MKKKKKRAHAYVDTQRQDSAYIIQPIDKNRLLDRNIDDIVEEVKGLSLAIDLDIAGVRVVNYTKILAGSFFTKNMREDIAAEIKLLSPSVVIINHDLSPIQQRNLEKEWNSKIIDRTGLILEIFGERAQTREGRLQVELAALEYQKSRLVRSWTHLERQRGGAGFMGGPGERQIELDRRIISKRITKLKKELENVRRTRNLGKKSRERVPFPIISLVGYTNAGKSTLFNHITKANVFAKDLLFATLDPTMRRITLPQNQKAILADTVGFISDLPTHLIAAFRATLEQVIQADVIVHVIDISHKDYMAQKNDVIKILYDLGIDYENDPRIIEVFNKIDLLDDDFDNKSKQENKAFISAHTGQGVDELLRKIAKITAKNSQYAEFKIDITNGKAIAWLHSHGEIIERVDDKNYANISMRISPPDLEKFNKYFGYSEYN